MERMILDDESTRHSLDTLELRNVIQKAVAESSRPLDLLGMDACLMSNLEVAYELRAEVGVIVGSEANEPNDGWPYTEILSLLVAEPTMTPSDFAKLIVRTYVDSYKETGEDPVTQAAISTSANDPFHKSMDVLAAALTEGAPEYWQEIARCWAKSPLFHRKQLADVGGFCDRLLQTELPEKIKKAAKDVKEDLEPNGFLLAEGHMTSLRQCRRQPSPDYAMAPAIAAEMGLTITFNPVRLSLLD
jgi:hypothetical protein